MIDTNKLNQFRTMDAQLFVDSVGSSDGPFIPVLVSVTDTSKWAIFGPYGVYADPSGSRTFKQQEDAHQTLHQWGIREFFENGDFKELP